MRSTLGIVVLLVGLLPGWARPEEPAAIRVVVWPALPLLVAHRMIDRYGPPDEVYYDRLIWSSHWPWKKIIVRSAALAAPLEQVVDYHVPADKLRPLTLFTRSLVVNAEQGELSVHSDREDINRLTLNLADDIISGRKTPQEARKFFLKIMELSAAGKTSPYTQRLLFKTLPTPPASRMERF